MNIVYACDDNFAEMLGISMISLFESNKSCKSITVYILDGGIGNENKARLASVGVKYNRKILFCDVMDLLSSDMKQQRGSLSTFSRLYIASILSEDMKKALYLDCDMLILKSLEKLYATDIDGLYCAGVRDCLSDDQLGLIGIDKGGNYLNAGVLLINLELWRRDDLAHRFEEFSDRYKGSVPYADQGIINGVTHKSSAVADLSFNCYTALFDFSYKALMTFRKPSRYYSEDEVSAALKSPVIVHFTTSFLSLRPWIKGCGHPYADRWQEFRAISPWAEAPLREDKRSVWKKAAVKVYKALPESIAVNIAGFLHARLLPALKKR